MALVFPTSVRARGLLRALAVVVTLAWSGLMVMELTGLGRWRALPMGGGRKFEARENRWIWHVPKRYATHLTEIRGSLTEDGRPLARAVSHREVRQHGSGRFRLHGRTVSFAPWDNSNPNTNGRSYVFHAPRPLSPWLLWGGLAAMIGTHGLARRFGGPPLPPVPAGESAPQRRVRPAVWALALFATALTVRALAVAADPEPTDGFMMARGMPYSDAAWWLDMAQSMADGHGLNGPSNGQRPVYPLLLSPLLALGASPVSAAQWLNVVLGACAAVVLGGLILRLAGPWAGLAAAAFLSIGGMQMKLLPLPMSETTGLALLVTALGFLWRGAGTGHPRDLVCGGLFFGLSNLACPFTLLALPPAAVATGMKRGIWRSVVCRGTWIAMGASLVLVPWLVRQKLAHGMATISLNGPQMLYATASPSGHYDTAITQPLMAAGVPSEPAAQARVYSQLFVEAVRRDPWVYASRLRNGFIAWWEKFDPRHPTLLALLMAFGTGSALVRWWRGAGPGALAAAAVAPTLVLAAARLPGLGWASLALVGAVATRDRRCWRFAALAASVILGCATMNALTSGALANRLWVMADWLLFSLAVLGLHHGVAMLSSPCLPLSRTASDPDQPVETLIPGLTVTAHLQAAWTVMAATLAAGLALRGPTSSPIAPPPPATVNAARATTLDRLGLLGRISEDHPLVWTRPVRLTSSRARIRAGEAIGHWSRAFTPRNHSRTVVAALTAENQPITLQIPGDARHLPSGPFLAVGLVNHDPKAFFGAEIEMIEILALWPLDSLQTPEAAPFLFPPRSTARSLLPPAP